VVDGVAQLATTDPIETAKGIGAVLRDPVGAAKAIANDIREKLNSGPEGHGESIGDVLLSFEGGGAVGKVGKASNIGCKLNKHILNNGPGCFVAGTAILTSSGYRPIETIEVGDRVTTVSGSAQLVGKK
jgi:hypothetical protein